MQFKENPEIKSSLVFLFSCTDSLRPQEVTLSKLSSFSNAREVEPNVAPEN